MKRFFHHKNKHYLKYNLFLQTDKNTQVGEHIKGKLHWIPVALYIKNGKCQCHP